MGATLIPDSVCPEQEKTTATESFGSLLSPVASSLLNKAVWALESSGTCARSA